MSAPLEVADDQFQAVRVASAALDEQYAAQVTQGDLSAIEINASSLDAYLSQSEIANSAVGTALQVGYRPVDDPADEDEESLARDRYDLLRALEMTNVKTVRELDDLLQRVAGDAPDVLRQILKRWLENNADPIRARRDNLLTMLVLYAGGAGADTAGQIYAEEVSEAIESLTRKPAAS